jgi:hypothetical protein
MATALTTLRATLATALTNAGVWNIYAYPPSVITANSVIVVPADPYITPSNNVQIIPPLANFRVLMTVPLLDNQGNLNGIEDTIVAVFNLLNTSAIVMNVGTVSAPSILSAASGDLLTADISVSILTSWS